MITINDSVLLWRKTPCHLRVILIDLFHSIIMADGYLHSWRVSQLNNV